MSSQRTLIPIYTTKGDLGAFLVYPYLYNSQGEWIGWVGADKKVYSVYGHYVGWLTDDPRILRKRADTIGVDSRVPPPPPAPLKPPAKVPLPRMMPELPFGVLDVLEENPDLLPCRDFGEMRQDVDY
jgi:hypothetical protein